MPSRVLLVLPTRTYRAAAFLSAARHAGLEAVVASSEASTLSAFMAGNELVLDLGRPALAADRAADLHARSPIDGVVGVDEAAVIAAAAIAQRLGLRHHPPAAVARTRDKRLLRSSLDAAGLRQPRWREASTGWTAGRIAAAAAAVGFPCVVKPVDLAASRGVIRADTATQAAAAAARIGAMLRQDPGCGQGDAPLLVERFVAGPEVAVEGLVCSGTLEVLAIFDKPDPMDGPFFEETLYVAPTRLPPGSADAVGRTVRAAVAALGLRDGPVHAEVRVGEDGPTVIEVAARSIGGLCSQAVRLRDGQDRVLSLEEVILRHSTGEDLGRLRAAGPATAVMMLPIPRAGRLVAVRGLDAARAVAGVDGAVLSVPVGTAVLPLPEGDRYLGFVFAHGDSPGAAEAALREAHSCLEVVIAEDGAAATAG